MINCVRYSCKSSVEYDLKFHYILRKQYEENLLLRSAWKSYRLKIIKSQGSHGKAYGIKAPDQDEYKYAGKERTEDLNIIREYAFYEKGLKIIDQNIKALEDFLHIYQNTGADHINELLSKAYRLPVDSPLLVDDVAVNDWLNDMRDKKKSLPLFDSDGLKVAAFDGTRMRSRAEATHYEAFYIYGVPAVYEVPYRIDNEWYYPDFTVLDIFNWDTKIWEYLGYWFHDNEYKRDRYRNDNIHRIDEYTKIGFYPEHNLILTFGAKGNIFNVQSIFRKVSMLALPPPSQETIDLLKRM